MITGSFCLALVFYACTGTKTTVKRDATGRILVDTTPITKPQTPEQALRNIYLQKGYHLELVASEPMVQEPVTMAWDGNGRLYVAEMNTYMQDIDGTGEDEPVCKIKRLEDTDGDGKMDKVTVYIDSLVLPRMILPLDNRVLVGETYSNHIYSYEDTNGDGKADVKKLVYENHTRDGRNLEHQKSGLVWNLDNRIYVTLEAVRYQFINDKLVPDTLIEMPWGQWGIGHDDYGRIYLNLGAGETPAMNFHQNPHYGQFNPEGQYGDAFQAVWPIIATPDVQGGPVRLRSDSTLNHFTGCTSPLIYRGDHLPADLKGDLLICEPVGRLIRRAKVINTEGRITLANAYDKQEFIASTDMNFRPVYTANGPDGTIYIADMYRGIIQEGNWTRPGSYLRPEILKKGLEKNNSRGRIYRLVHDNHKGSKVSPRLLDETSVNLVGYLSHPNGWWRDYAQKLLVLRKDRAVVPVLAGLVKTAPLPLTRIHALWTLNGMGALNKDLLFYALNEKDYKVRKNAVWVAEDFAGDAGVLNRLEQLKDDADPEVRYQLALALRFNKSKTAKEVIAYMVSKYPNSILALSQKKYDNLVAERELSAKKAALLSDEQKKLVTEGAGIFKQLCAACHGSDGKGITSGGKSMVAPPLANNKDVNGDPEKLIKILLHGLKGPIDGKTYPDIMPALGANSDNYIASVLSYIRNDLGNKAKVIKPEDVKRVRQETSGRKTNYTMQELEAAK
ncbi:cytochrome C [Mucilaginibacter hurinus]|uniref:Cytochrome C n=1 Tax=Mucilaginibacter hurinus TaxID=2201324 RepID=A0A367GPR1_9SPHI|nr:cytochrome C [Mucilaginibacter hurinus]